MKRAAIVALVVMGLALAGCGAATLTESVPVAGPAAPQTRLGASAVTSPGPRLSGGLQFGGLAAQPAPAAVPDGATAAPASGAPVRAAVTPEPPTAPVPTTVAPAPAPAAAAAPAPVNIYSHTTNAQLSPAVAGVPLRAYVPNSDAASVSVIDPATMKVVGQFAVGVFTVTSIVLAKQITTAPGDEYRATYAFMETAVGLGNLIGGFALGLITTRVRKGRLIIAAYVAFGALVFLVGNVSSVLVVLGLLFGVGVANMAFIIPSQTLFQERTPPELMGRVVSFRFAIVFGGMSIAMAVGGLLTTAFGPGPVIAAAGLISMAAGFGGLLVKQLREA